MSCIWICTYMTILSSIFHAMKLGMCTWSTIENLAGPNLDQVHVCPSHSMLYNTSRHFDVWYGISDDNGYIYANKFYDSYSVLPSTV